MWRLTLQPVATVQPALLCMGICTLSCSAEQTRPKVALNSWQGPAHNVLSVQVVGTREKEQEVREEAIADSVSLEKLSEDLLSAALHPVCHKAEMFPCVVAVQTGPRAS